MTQPASLFHSHANKDGGQERVLLGDGDAHADQKKDGADVRCVHEPVALEPALLHKLTTALGPLERGGIPHLLAELAKVDVELGGGLVCALHGNLVQLLEARHGLLRVERVEGV